MSAERLVPLPLADGYEDPAVPFWGHCQAFCNDPDSRRTDGLTVEEHGGPLCRSGMIAYIEARDRRAQRATLAAAVVAPYLHGRYAPGSRPSLLQPLVELSLAADGVAPDEGDTERSFYISVGDALRLAASLVRAAEVADGLDRNFNAAKAARQADRE